MVLRESRSKGKASGSEASKKRGERGGPTWGQQRRRVGVFNGLPSLFLILFILNFLKILR